MNERRGKRKEKETRCPGITGHLGQVDVLIATGFPSIQSLGTGMTDSDPIMRLYPCENPSIEVPD